jgi:hypothetical protein
MRTPVGYKDGAAHRPTDGDFVHILNAIAPSKRTGCACGAFCQPYQKDCSNCEYSVSAPGHVHQCNKLNTPVILVLNFNKTRSFLRRSIGADESLRTAIESTLLLNTGSDVLTKECLVYLPDNLA